MAVQMRTGASADLMQTNAAQASRKTAQGTQNELSAGDGFKNFLDGGKNLSSVRNSQNMSSQVKQQSVQAASKDVTADVSDDVSRVVEELREDKRFEKALEALDRATGHGELESGAVSEDVSENVKELAQKVLDGELDIDDIPDDIPVDELIKELIALMMQRLHPSKDDDREKEPEMFDPATAAVNEHDLDRNTTDQLISELYKLIEKRGGNKDEKKVTILDGISEPITVDETLASVATGELHAEQQADEGAFEQIIDNMVETAQATEEVETIGTVAANSESAQAVQTQSDAGSLQNAASEAAAEGAEQAVAAAEQGSQSDGAQTRFGGQAQKTEQVENGVDESELDNVIESFTVKEANVSEPAKTEAPVKANVTGGTQARVQNASEELEMLKSAKLGKKEPETDVVSAQTASPLTSEQPIVFTRADGTRFEVNPSEIVDQTAKIIETAIRETQQQSEYSLVLNPEELGRITVKLIKAADGAVSVTIAAENAHTQRVLEQHSELMQSNLRANGTNLASWQTVNESRQETYAQDYNGSSKNPYFRRDDAQHADEDNTDTTFADLIAAM